jgi:putative ABC transport system permease protein
MLTDSFLLSVKNLRHRGVRSWLTLLGIFIGVTAVVALISLGNGLQVAVSSQFGVSQTELITVQASGVGGFGPPGSGVVTPLDQDDLEAIEKLSSVKRAAGRVIENGKLEYNNKLIFGYLVSIPSGEDRDFIYSQLDDGALVGRLLEDSDSRKVFLGYNFYTNSVGLEKAVVPGKDVLIQNVEFEVIGILEKKGSFVFDNAVYMNEDDMDDLFNFGEELDTIVAQPVDSDNMDKTVEDIKKALRKTRGVKEGEEDFSVSTPEASLESVNSILGGVQAFIVIVASISIFIGALGIVNTMTTSVWERKKEIGIMKAIGARNSDIFLQFFIESSLLGLLGGLAGVLFGTIIGLVGLMGINNFIGAEVEMGINFSLIFFALLGSFIIGGLAGIVPALKAAKQNPVEAIRS